MAFTTHKFTLDGVEHKVQSPSGSEASEAIAKLIEQHAEAMNTPQWSRFITVNEDGSERWTMRMVGGRVDTYDVKQVEE